jgi:phospholipid/cholesterol/gamma-HCH transport system ATP-binding protein
MQLDKKINTLMIETIHHIDTKENIISIEGLKKSFNANVVLNGIDVNIVKGENMAVLGRSGSGKSVLIKIISGLLKPDSGIVKVFDKEVVKLNKKELQELRLKIGFSFQNSALYDSMSVRDNLAFPLVRTKRNLKTKEVNNAIESVLNDVGLLQTIYQMPSELSGGQRKRIGIARTLIMKPEIMLYDEPTAGLDPITCNEINNLIVKVQQQYNASAIIITHDLTCAKTTANKVTMIVDGKFLAPGKFEEIFNATNLNTKEFYDYNFINNL